MKNREDYSKYLWAGGVLTLAVILVFGLYSTFQPSRMYAKSMEFQHEAIERGEEYWEHDCATCHGAHGEGVRNSGPALNTKEFLEAAPDALIFNTITDGRPGTSMPAWGQPRGGPYNAEVVHDLTALIRSWEPGAPSEGDMVYEGDPVEGAVLFSTTCFACHGVSGEGTASGAPLNDPEKLAKFGDDYYRDVIGRGRPDRGMPTWGSVLSPDQIEDLVRYVRSWENVVPAQMASLGGDTVRGKEIFDSTCVVCHGPGGMGTAIAPQLADAPILQDAEALYAAVSGGRLDVGMPNWGQVLSPAEINDVSAYVSVLTADPNAQPEPEQDTGPDPLETAQFLYMSQCASCHGLAGEGKDDKPALIGNAWLAENDDAALAGLITDGRVNTAMEGFVGVLSDEEVEQIILLVRSWQ